MTIPCDTLTLNHVHRYSVSFGPSPEGTVFVHEEGEHKVLLDEDAGQGQQAEHNAEEEMRHPGPGVEVDLRELAAHARAQQEEEDVVVRQEALDGRLLEGGRVGAVGEDGENDPQGEGDARHHVAAVGHHHAHCACQQNLNIA